MKKHCAICHDVFNGFGSLCDRCWQEQWGAYLAERHEHPMHIVNVNEEDTRELPAWNTDCAAMFDAQGNQVNTFPIRPARNGRNE